MNGIQVKYTELFRISIQQLYYQNKVCKEFKIQPEPDIQILPIQNCLVVMNRLNIVFRNTDANGGFFFFLKIGGKKRGGEGIFWFSPQKKKMPGVFLFFYKNPLLQFFDISCNTAHY